MLKGNLWFPFTNPGFSALLGGIYWLLGYWLIASRVTWPPRPDVAIIVFLLLIAGFVSYTGYQERWRLRALLLTAVHAAAHFAALLLLAWLFRSVNFDRFGLEPIGWAQFVLLAPEMIVVGGAVAGFIFGVNLLLTCRYADMNHNDAFSAMRLDSHRNFLRLRIKSDELKVYPIGVDSVPRRDQWRDNPHPGAGTTEPLFVPEDGSLRPRLIEGPVVIDARKVPPAAETIDPPVADTSRKPDGAQASEQEFARREGQS